MNYSENLNIYHETKSSGLNVLTKLNKLEIQIDPDFLEMFKEYKEKVKLVLKENPEQANNPDVIAEIEIQNIRVADIFGINFEKKRKRGIMLKAANDDIELEKAA